jgi:heptosyltransferase III
MQRTDSECAVEKGLVPSEILQKEGGKILFVTHLALGDFTYLKTYFSLLKKQYPNLVCDLWIDESRRKFFTSKKFRAQNILYQWVASTNIFRKVYQQTFLRKNYIEFKKEIVQKKYDLVVSLATLRPYRYARLARELCPEAFIVGSQKPFKIYNILKWKAYRSLDQHYYFDNKNLSKEKHINQIYRSWFESMFQLETTEQNTKPSVDIPRNWIEFVKKEHIKNYSPDSFYVFINIFSKDEKRHWQLEKAVDLIYALQSHRRFSRAVFFVNSLPHNYDEVDAYLNRFSRDKIKVFLLKKHFFELPALLSLCSFVISVETSIIHLSTSLGVSTVSLMRTKNPEWQPFSSQGNSSIVFTKNRRDIIRSIEVKDVKKVVLSLFG